MPIKQRGCKSAKMMPNWTLIRCRNDAHLIDCLILHVACQNSNLKVKFSNDKKADDNSNKIY